MDWELVHIDSEGEDHLYRFSVPGGWLYRYSDWKTKIVTVTFVPFPTDYYPQQDDPPNAPDASTAANLEAALS